jgi:hypothetical protein
MTAMMGCLLLAMSTLALLAPAKEAEDSAQHAQTTLRSVAAMSAPDQHAWLRRLEARLDWAARLTLAPEEADRQRARVAAVLRQETASWPDLVELVRLLDQREKAAIARLVRQYRAQVNETFGQQRPALVERQEAWYRVWALWEAAGSPPDQQDRLMTWLYAAIRNSMKDSIKPLPADPRFDASPALATRGPVVPARPSPRKPASPRVDLTPVPTRVPDPIVAIARRAAQTMPRGFPERARYRMATATGRIPPARVPLCSIQVHREPASEIAAEVAMIGLTSRPALPRKPAPLLPSTEPAMVSGTAVARANGSPASGQLRAAFRPLFERPAPDLPRPRVEGPENDDGVPRSAPPLVLRTHDAPAPLPSPEVEPMPRQSPRHDLIALLPKSVPLAPRTAGALREAPGTLLASPKGERPRAGASPTDAAGHGEDAAGGRVTVNIEQLAARIEGNNLALRTLEADLEARHDWSADQLEGVLNRADMLVLRQRDLTLFRDLITPEEQDRVGRIESPQQLFTQLGTRIAEIRRQVAGSDFLGTDAERQAEVRRLRSLSERLAELTREK